MRSASPGGRSGPSPSLLVALAGLALAVHACGGSPPPAPAPVAQAPPAQPSSSPRPAGSGAPAAKPIVTGPIVSPSTLLPDLVGDRGVVSSEEGYRRVLRDRMRLIVRDDGSLERAAELIGVTDQPISS